jgi:hypothetical protein
MKEWRSGVRVGWEKSPRPKAARNAPLAAILLTGYRSLLTARGPTAFQ